MIDISKNEEEILGYWKANDILNKIREKNKGSKTFYFLDGPPFVSGDLHPAQIWTKTIKDVEIRYKRYRGFEVVDRAGYDVHGLPVENRLEKELGIQSKKDIEEKIGVEAFVKECKSYVERYIGRMDADYERFGISLDFKNPYLPYKNEYIETAWQMFKRASDKGFLYRGKRTLIYCPHCETPLSQGSMEVEYKDVDDPSIYVAFKIDEKRSKPRIEMPSNTYLVIWTTTPWTLPSNVAVAVNPKNIYLLISTGERNLIVAKDRLDSFVAATGDNAVVLKEFFGSELDGIYYTSPLEGKVPEQKKLRKYHRVIFSESLVSMGEGTGLVHMAPGNGIEDFAVGKLNKLPVFSPLNPDATYNGDAGAYRGIKVPVDANKAVIVDLQEYGVLLNQGTVHHSYPYCWRCSSKLIFLATDQWFMNIQKIKKKTIRQNEKVKWHPDEVRNWQRAVLENSPDWCISRQRYWGIPMPIWICASCKKEKVVGSRNDLAASAVNPDEVKNLQDMHRPYIDRIKLRCECGGEMVRVKDILDVWFDSGITFRASVPTEEQFERVFPVDLIVEYVEQIRAWFQYLMKCGVMVYGKIPFKHVIVHGIMAGNDGRKMSKSFGNYKPLDEITKTLGADAFRLWSVDHQPILNRNFKEAEIKESQKTVIMLYNISDLVQEYEGVLEYRPKPGKKPSIARLDEIDRWMISRVESVVKECTTHLDNYEPYRAAVVLTDFVIEDFSRFYLKSAKKRMNYSVKTRARAILETVNYALYKILMPISLIMPFASESIYQKRFGTHASIFLEIWPKASEKLINKELETDMKLVQETITAILSDREKVGMKLRQPLANTIVQVSDDSVMNSLQRQVTLLEDYANIRKVEIKKGAATGKEVRPLFEKIGPDFKQNAGAVAEALRNESADKMLTGIVKVGHYSLHTEKGTFSIDQTHFTIIEKALDERALVFKYGVVSVDPKIDEELREEALIREFERGIQLLRKEMLLKKADKVRIYCKIAPGIETIINKHKKEIIRDINATDMLRMESDTDSREIEIEGEMVKIKIVKE